METLLEACIARDGMLEGQELYDNIISECREAILCGDVNDIETILYDNQFEMDYLMDIMDTLV